MARDQTEGRGVASIRIVKVSRARLYRALDQGCKDLQFQLHPQMASVRISRIKVGDPLKPCLARLLAILSFPFSFPYDVHINHPSLRSNFISLDSLSSVRQPPLPPSIFHRSIRTIGAKIGRDLEKEIINLSFLLLFFFEETLERSSKNMKVILITHTVKAEIKIGLKNWRINRYDLFYFSQFSSEKNMKKYV